MIVVDSSVLIDAIRSPHSPAYRTLRELGYREVLAIGDVILLEVLRGALNEQHAARIDRDLRRLTVLGMLSESLARKAAANHRHLRRLGITVHSIVDMIVGTYCIEGGYALLHDDADFRPMVKHLGLREYRPSA